MNQGSETGFRTLPGKVHSKPKMLKISHSDLFWMIIK